MATKKGYGQSGNSGSAGSGGYGRGRVSEPSDVGYSTAQGESIVVAVGLVICMLLLVGFITLTGFLYADLRAAQGANKKVERRVNELKHQYEVDCRKKDYE